MLAESADLDVEAQSIEDRCKLAMCRAFPRIQPNDQNGRRGQILDEPIESGLERLDGAALPIDQRDSILTVRKAAGRKGCNTAITAAMQGQNELGRGRPCDNDAMKLGAARKVDHGVDNALAGWNGSGCAHIYDPTE